MRRFGAFPLWFWWSAVIVFAQPTIPATTYVAPASPLGPSARSFEAATALSVNPAAREEVRQFFRAVYSASDGVPMGWTGNYAAGAFGDTSAAFKEAVRLRINFFRALAGLPATVTFRSDFSVQDQSAALMMSGNNTLQHTGIPTSWTFYTTAGANAAANSNIALGIAGPAAIDGYIADNGAGNEVVGHRRWLLYPQTREMGTGDVPGNGTFSAANAVWVLDGLFGSTRPTTRTTAVPYPYAGFIPYQLVWPRWSFSYPGADFSVTTVTMTRAGVSVPAVIENRSGSIGEPTLSWVYNGLDPAVATPHPRPAADTTYSVAVNGVRIAGASQSFSYNVTVFDPDVAGGDFVTTTINGPGAPPVNTPSSYTVTKPAFADSFQVRTLTLAAFAKVYGAEAGLDGLIASTGSGYPTVQASVKAAGTSAYQLAHVSPRTDQILLLPETFVVRDATATASFLSRLTFATPIQIAKVQISTDDGVFWTDLYSQAGTNNAGETSFTSRTLSLASYVGRTVRVRLNYSIGAAGSAFEYSPSQTNVGWFVDDLTLTGVVSATAAAPMTVSSGSTVALTPTAVGPITLQARGQLFGTYPLEWSAVTNVTAVPASVVAANGRLTNLAIRSVAGTGAETLIVGLTVGGTGTSGAKPLLVRAAGPALTAFGVAGALVDPRLDMIDGNGAVVASNDNWTGDANVIAVSNQVGAFPFSSTTSLDAALYRAGSAGGYSVKVSGAGSTTGVALAEIYDATPSASFTATTPRLINVSARTQVGTGANILIAGLTVGGTGPVNVLIRAIGPGLTQFGLGGVLADPQLEVFNGGSSPIARNDNWDSATTLAAATSVGAFPLTNGSRDAVLVTSLPPGGYTVQISGVNNTTGVALVEVYELP